MAKMNWNRVNNENLVREKGFRDIRNEKWYKEAKKKASKQKKAKPPKHIRMISKTDGKCVKCNMNLRSGKPMIWFPDLQKAMHPGCFKVTFDSA